MSRRYKGGVISATAITTSSTTATGVFTLQQQMQAKAASLWPTPIPPGQQDFIQATYSVGEVLSWTAPTGVTSISVLVVCGGTFNSGGGLSYRNNYAVTPGNTYKLTLGGNGSRSIFYNNAAGDVQACAASSDGAIGVGTATYYAGTGWGAASAGYSSNGPVQYGAPDDTAATGASGLGGSGGNGGSWTSTDPPGAAFAAGGGIGLLGQGSNGAGGTATFGGAVNGGAGGSGGADGQGAAGKSIAANGGTYGGGGNNGNGTPQGGKTAIRVIWPGTARQFPSTRTTNE
jgi:hypothetical protein